MSVCAMYRFLLFSVLFIFTAGQNLTFNEDSTWQACACDRGPCSCVVYYLCGLDGNIITSGHNIVDERFGQPTVVKRCPSGQLCCRNPEEADPDSQPSEKPAPVAPPVTLSLPSNNPAVNPWIGPTEPQSTSSRPPQRPSDAPWAGSNTPICGLRGTAFGLDEVWARIGADDSKWKTAFAEFPWMLGILGRNKSNPNQFICGASLVHQRVVITAAHCLKRRSAEDLLVRAGEWNTTSEDEPVPHQDRFVTEIIKHPEFNSGSLFNDIALLVLNEPFEDAINVGIACLPELGANFNSQRCLATGWGRDSYGKRGQMHTTLRKVDLPIIERVSCQERLRRTRLGIYFRLDKSFICAGGEPEKDTCQGDGGGPLMCQSRVDPERYIQVGIVSWGIGCKDSDTPAVYADMVALRPWVDSKLSELGVSAVIQA